MSIRKIITRLCVVALIGSQAAVVVDATSASATTANAPMTLTINTAATGCSGLTVTLPLNGTVNATVNWGDGVTTAQSVTTANPSYTYTTGGTYTISITGSATGFGSSTAFCQLTGVTSWGTNGSGAIGLTGLTSLADAFFNDTNLTNVPADFPVAVTLANQMFDGATSFNENISTWNTAAVTNMSGMFANDTAFNDGNAPLPTSSTGWNTAAVTNMSLMFNNDTAFNQDISTWNTAAVTNMNSMFYGDTAFNQSLGALNVSKVTDMTSMLSGTSLTVANYDATLVGWAGETVVASVPLGATGLIYDSTGATARNTLTSSPDSWTITGDSLATDTVTFNSMGGSSVSNLSGPDGSTITLPSAPTYAGYTFNGWFAAVSGGTALTSPYTLTGSVTLYAQWTVNATDTITFNAEGGSPIANLSGPNGSTITLPPETYAGYTFNGWFAAASGGTALTSPYTLTGSVTLYAQWTAIDYVSLNGIKGIGTVPVLSGLNGATITLPTETYAGYTFNGWFAAASGGTALTSPYTLTGSVTLYAQWTANATDTVTFNTEGGSSVANLSGLDGTTVTLPSAPIYAGHTFNGWFAAASGGTALTSPYTLTGSVTLYAQWAANATGTVTFNTEGGSSVANLSGLDGTTVTLPSAPVRTGYVFDGWFTAATGGAQLPSSYIITGTVTVYAQWTANATDTVTFNSEGGSPVGVMTGLNGSTINLPSPTYTGHTFDGWFTTAIGGTRLVSPYTLTTLSTTLYAQWTLTAPTNAPPPSGAPTSSFGTPVSTKTTGVLTSITVSSGGASAVITVPAGALPTDTVVTAYPVINPTTLAASVPSGKSYVASFAVSWQATDGTAPTATSPLTMVITDSNILVGDTIYVVTPTGLKATGTATVNGTATVTFTTDPIFVIAHTTATPVVAAVPRAFKVYGFVAPNKTRWIDITGVGFYGRPTIVSHSGTTAMVVKDTGRWMRVRVSVKAGSRNGTFTFTITLANGKSTKVRYIQR